MAEFVRGARIRPRDPDPPLTMEEASLVMVDVARRHGGISDLKAFVTYMARAWICYERAAETQEVKHE